MTSNRRLGNLKQQNTVFFLCDMQERFRQHIIYFTEILETTKRLIDAAKILEMPLIVTEQYPKGLGATVTELNITGATCVVPKTDFSMMTSEVRELMPSLCKGAAQHVVLFGIETHVCIQKTTIDLLEAGYEVHIVADATSSRNQTDRLFALTRLRDIGALVTTTESVLLQLIGSKDHTCFKEVQALIKSKSPDTGLLQYK